VKLLLCSFYFPPAGGGGVQRPLKLAEHLAALDFEVHVLAPDDPKWIHRDEELSVPARIRVHRTHYPGPKGRLPAEELYGRRGLGRIFRRAALMPRRLLLPDENVLWNATAIPAATRVVRREGIDVLLTTSPPSSVHLLGGAVKRRTGVRWVADLRDSLVANPNRRVDGRAAKLKEHLHGQVATLVARQADGIVAVTETIASEMRNLAPSAPIAVIPNGCDYDDFAGLQYRANERFRITHTGSFFGKRDPRPFLRALAESELDVVARFVGDFRRADRDWAMGLGLGDRLELLPFVDHRRTLELQRDSEALLLLLPEVGERGRDVPSGKLYEYLAAGRPILAAVPPDGAAANLVERAGAGIVVSPNDVAGQARALGDLVERRRRQALEPVRLEPGLRRELSRETRSGELAAFLRTLG